ncbi:flagellar protein export ATPase FliI [Acidithiobacillus caldus]|jgi:flagellum-specific ATP synthase|nr:flagellar protein export ATPase FliI [Acidithiobacillus caldus]AIA55124.1 Flagellum-specific ATP synthase FliI [Acidithiobacillus caldus ATCC 51756]AUW32777.1 flagellar protein export ATPase FliI [Acidithiobacillus caldus]MBU2730256.1 flagellar protein export ATPase FliI [Acidithiobacillus caldus]MBU2734329.1 flagellar protein export ATPase FliI [Acidithiobacillus caldus ATCC 51756]MBU2745812.1 flagellar protein export ATPase FliI [Acidithiobacillus caldus]
MTHTLPERQASWAEFLGQWHDRLPRTLPPPLPSGRLVRMVGLVLEAEGMEASVGSRCRVIAANQRGIDAEVVGFHGERLQLMAAGDTHGVALGARVQLLPGEAQGSASPALLGRVIDGLGQPLDGGDAVPNRTPIPLMGTPLNPMNRMPIRHPLDVGVRSINALFTVGRGARMGLFAGSGVGKSVLLGMMARNTEADVIVVGLIGERGREVKEFIEDILGEAGLRRAVVVAAPADAPALTRIRGAHLATALAEYFRDRGQHVLLLMDSLTRYAMAQREIALAVGEPPAVRGYPPSVFARLPALVERAGNGGRDGGSITAFYTVLMEGDDQQDPIADSARAILDGHLVLSRSLAEQGHYPAIDLEASISRVMPNIVPAAQLQALHRLKRLYGRYREQRDLIAVGAYSAGLDPVLDQAVQAYPAIEAFLQQDQRESVDLAQAQAALAALMAPYLGGTDGTTS